MIGKDPVAEDLVDGSGEVGRIAARNPQTGPAVINEGAKSTDIGCHDRNTAGRRFQRHEPERLAARRDENEIGCPIVGGEQVVRLGWHHGHPLGEPSVSDCLLYTSDAADE